MYIILAFCFILNLVSSVLSQKVCLGTSVGLQATSGSGQLQQYESYKTRYKGCVIVSGNLELTHLDEQDNFDLSFLQDIEEVTGYVLIVEVFSSFIPLNKLRIIRGWSLFDKQHSLYIGINHKKSSQTVGLRELHLPALAEITKGNVFIHDNALLCHVDTINWKDIISKYANYSIGNEVQGIKKSCAPCNESCVVQGKARCWAAGSEYCQKLSHVICAEQCIDETTGSGRCFGTAPNECCHAQCAAGCTGTKNTNCLVCANFNNSGSCVERCPPQKVYDPKQHVMVDNPNFRYTFSTLCLKECPEHYWISGDQCVIDCGSGKIADENRNCISCGGACPKECPGLREDEFLDSLNIDNFANCTKVKGRLRILDHTFLGMDYDWMDEPIPPLDPARLSILSTIQEISEDVFIQANFSGFTNIDFLKNLTTIRRQSRFATTSLLIDSTSIRVLGLDSLKSANGDIYITKNRQMCLAESIDWTSIVPSDAKIVVAGNKAANSCLADGIVCDKECKGGCWDMGNTNCLGCQHFLYNGACIATCDTSLSRYTTDGVNCTDCDEQCIHGCHGPGNSNCTVCRNYKDGPYCVGQCPSVKYPDLNKECQPCAEFCSNGCTGPSDITGKGGCNTCEFGEIVDKVQLTARCINPEPAVCRDGYYKRSAYKGPMKSKNVCFKCHSECLTCFGDRNDECWKCANYFIPDVMDSDNVISTCVSSCPKEYFADDKMCLSCDEQCIGCHGNSSFDCTFCKTAKIYIVDEDGSVTNLFNCTAECPDDLPYKYVEYSENGHQETVCSSQPRISMALILGIVIPVIILLIIVAVIAILVVRHWRREALKQKYLEPQAPESPLDVTDAKPDMSYLRLVKESDLKKGAIIGSGAFGTVYKGYWVPAKEGIKIPVAIKVLSSDGSITEQNKELLDEARIMFSVNHVCCVRVIAICMAQQMMLVTQLMPLGCLLDYVRKNKHNVGSRDLLTWCTQIAKGMEYLEHLGIVHRDLAARNVLVQKPNHVRITDFGLARLLDYNQDEYQAQSGKVPIKWLALESIRYRIFTHKTDVWSYGVTLWELFTFGQRPYENISAMQMLSHLEKGERLDQPEICTIDVFMIMIKCWMLDAGSRPTFTELVTSFSQMSRDPGRYLVVEGDKFKRLPSTHYRGGEDIDAGLHSLSIEMEDIPQTTMTADEYLRSGEFGDDDGLDINIPQDDYDPNSPLKQPNRVNLPDEKYKSSGDYSQKNRRSPGARSRYTSEPTRHGDRPPAEPAPMPPLPLTPARYSNENQQASPPSPDIDDIDGAAAAVPLLRGQYNNDYAQNRPKSAQQQRDSEYLEPKKSPTKNMRESEYLDPPKSQSNNTRESEYLEPRKSQSPSNNARGSDYLEPKKSQLNNARTSNPVEPKRSQINNRESDYLEPKRATKAPNNARESEYVTPRSSHLDSSRESEYLTPRNSQLDNGDYIEPKKQAQLAQSPPRGNSTIEPKRQTIQQPQRNSDTKRQSQEDDYMSPKPVNLNMYMDIVPDDDDDDDDDKAKSTRGTAASNPLYLSMGPVPLPPEKNSSPRKSTSPTQAALTSSQRKSASPPAVSAKPSKADVARASTRHNYPKIQSPVTTEAEYFNSESTPLPPSDAPQPMYLDMSGQQLADSKV